MEEQAKYEVATAMDNSPAALMIKAMAGGMDLDKLEKFMLLQEKYEANQARKAYNLAMADFKAESIVVIKDKTNLQYKSRYASEGSLFNTVNPLLSKHGLSASFDFVQGASFTVSCTITHSGGHKETVSLTGPIDSSGSKNPLQQIKSTVTYLRKAAFEAITGIASSDEEADDDGAGATVYVDEKQLSTIIDMINAKGVDLKKFLVYMNAGSVENILASDYNKAITGLKSAKGKEA